MNNNTLDLAGLLADNTPEGMEVDMEKSTLQKVVFKSKEVSTRWKELGNVSGWYTDTAAYVNPTSDNCDPTINNANIYATEAQCKAHLAQAKLSQIMKRVNGDWEQDINEVCWYIHWGYNDEWIVDPTKFLHFLTFKSQELAKQVLRENAELLEQYKPLAG